MTVHPKKIISRIIETATGIIYPRTCEMCGRSLIADEHVLCLHCRASLPITDMHRITPNPLEERLAGTLPIERAAGYCHYDRGAPYALLIQHAKYHGRPAIMRWLAARYASILQKDGFFDGIDGILPAPMHVYKKMRRGYNQADWVAKGVSEITGLPVMNNLEATRNHDTQTHRGSFSRWENAQSLYRTTHPSELDGLHLLLVDDVVTTGATILACAASIRQSCPTARLSIFTIAVARMS